MVLFDAAEEKFETGEEKGCHPPISICPAVDVQASADDSDPGSIGQQSLILFRDYLTFSGKLPPWATGMLKNAAGRSDRWLSPTVIARNCDCHLYMLRELFRHSPSPGACLKQWA